MGDGQVMTGKSHTNKGINLVLREDYVEQENPPLNSGVSLTIDSSDTSTPSLNNITSTPSQTYLS
jgi:hypothetical protein